jgi:hypothetical protein
MTVPPASLISLRTAFRRSSNSPRYFEPASSAPMSSAMTRPVAQRLGHVAGLDALGEALDDGGLADAGLADEHGLFLVRRLRTWMTRRISSSRPDDRVELALLGASVRSRPNFSSAWYLSSATGR